VKEFKVNEYITLKLEGGKTNIYVKEELFNQCKFLILNIHVSEISSFEEIDSIDEAAEKLDKSLEGSEGRKFKIPPDVEFWGHCSNLQVWAEMSYDTRILHRNIAFPLLRELYFVGDPIAKQVFTEQVVKRLESWEPVVVQYLWNQGYLDELEHKMLFTGLSRAFKDERLFLKNLNLFFALVKNLSYTEIYALNGEPLSLVISRILEDKTKKKTLFRAMLDSFYTSNTKMLKHNGQVMLILQAIVKELNKHDISWIIGKIMKNERFLKEIIKPTNYHMFDNKYFKTLKLHLFIEILKKDDLIYKYISDTKSNILILLGRINSLITVENLKEIKAVRDEIIKRLNGDDMDLIADLIQSRSFFEYIKQDDIQKIFNDSEINLEGKLLKILQIRKKIKLKILKLYLLINENCAYDILHFFLYEILNNPDSELNENFFNEPLLQNLKWILSSEVKNITEILNIPNKVIKLVFEKLKEEQTQSPNDFGFDLLDPGYFSIAPKGINELFESLDYRIYQNLGWKYDTTIIIPILESIREFYPKDFQKGLFWFIEKYGFEHEIYSSHHANFVNDLSRENFWKLIGSGKEALIELEREIGQKLYILNNDDKSRNSGFIMKNRQIQELSVGEVNLQQLPESIGNLKNLKKIHIISTSLSSLPDSFKNLASLEELNLSENNFSTLPDVIGKLSSLKKLWLDWNPLKNLPDSLGELNNLQLLTMFDNQLESLPETIGNMASLQEIDISNNHKNTISFLPDSICNLRKLKSLKLFGCKIEYLPTLFGNLESLQYLHISNTRINSLPDSMQDLINLKELDLTKTGLRTIPSWIVKLQGLEKLVLSQLGLEEIPKSINQMVNLKDLNLSNNNISVINNIENLKNLYYLDLGYNKIEQMQGFNGLYNLTFLELCKNKIVKIKGLEDNQQLQRFSIGGNPIDDKLFEDLGGVETKQWPFLARVPRNFVEYCRQNLVSENAEFVWIGSKKYYVWKNSLDLSGFGIQTFDQIEGLENLTNLEVLNLRKNNIRQIKNLENLKNLRILNLAQNRIRRIEGLENLINLEVLNINYNKTLVEIEGVDALKNLRQLKLNRNKITEISNIENLAKLEFLDLMSNKISKIKNLAGLESLNYVNLSSNEISNIGELQQLKNLNILVVGKNKVSIDVLLEKTFKFEIKESDPKTDDIW
jgi:Leucine-rich repeat (LRR) protein